MNFQLANKGPIHVEVDGRPYDVPRFVRRDWVAWAAELDAKRSAAAVAHLPKGEARARFLTVYPVMPVDTTELTRHAFTTAGTERILRTCLGRAGVPAETIDRLFAEAEDVRQLDTLAVTLASLYDPTEVKDEGEAEVAEGDGTLPGEGKAPEKPDPLPSAGSGSPG
jgi:hypothetical protein